MRIQYFTKVLNAGRGKIVSFTAEWEEVHPKAEFGKFKSSFCFSFSFRTFNRTGSLLLALQVHSVEYPLAIRLRFLVPGRSNANR